MRGQQSLAALLVGLALAGCATAPPAASIHEAARLGDRTGVIALLDGDSGLVGKQDADGQTPLHHAASEGHAELARLLVERGSDVGARDAQERTPLHVAANAGDAEMVKLLLDAGSGLMDREFRGRTPLQIAANFGNDLETVRLLVEAGADVNDRTPTRGEEVLFSTLFYGRPEIIDYLLDAGARLPDDTRSILRSVYVSASNGLERVFRLAVEKADQGELEWWRRVPFHGVARGGSVAIAEAFAAREVELDGKNSYGVTPLHIAAENGRLELAEHLVERGASLDETIPSGLTAWHFARQAGHEDLANRLAALGASTAPRVFPALRGPYLGQEAPEGEPRPFALGIVSGHGFDNEHSPAVFSPDGREMFWTLKFKGPILRMRREDGVWTAPEPVLFNSDSGDGEPIFTPTGQRLYFNSFRPIEPGAGTDKENIWYLERVDDGWSEARPVSPAVNDLDLHWCISADESGTLYFSSVADGGLGGKDVYRSRLVDGVHQAPENLGSGINTESGEHTPFIAPDGSYLIFSADGRSSGGGRFHFFISYRAADESWLPPVSLTEELGSPYNPLCPVVTADGKYLFYIAGGDVWWADAGFIERLRPR
jgi:ankyrin repeat protein